MSNQKLFHAGLFCMKEAVYNVLLEASKAMSKKEISRILDIENSYQDASPDYMLLEGILDALCREGRVVLVNPGRTMTWSVVS